MSTMHRETKSIAILHSISQCHVISVPSFADQEAAHEDTQEDQTSAEYPTSRYFRILGTGSFGVIIAHTGTDSVLKLATGLSSGPQALWNEMICYATIYEAWAKYKHLLREDIRIPQVEDYIPFTRQYWWSENARYFPNEVPVDLTNPPNALRTQRIFPVPNAIHQAIITLFCDSTLQQTIRSSPKTKDSLLRIYLGKDKTTTSRPRRLKTFSMVNYPLSLDEMRKGQMPYENYTVSIAGMLAVIHWGAEMDARDVEFVLGSTPKYSNGIPPMGEVRKLAPTLTSIRSAVRLLPGASTSTR